MQKSRILFLLLILACFKLEGQNLVPNPSFEYNDSCPQNMDQLHFARPWFSPTAGTPDLFNTCSPPNQYGVNVPKNVIGYQFPRTGSAYAGFGTGAFSQPITIREYISTRLSDTLLPGKKYCVEFYVSLGDSSIWGMDRIGVFFERDSLINNAVNYLYYDTAQIESDSGLVYSDTSSWVKISGNFIAQGGEQYITIGNFHSDSVTTTDSLPAGTWYTAYYYIDDVSVYMCEDTSVPTPPIYDPISLTPSPSNGSLSLKGNFPEGTKLKVYDAIGREVANVTIDCGNCEKPLFLPLAVGAYIYRVESAGVNLKTGKLVIEK